MGGRFDSGNEIAIWERIYFIPTLGKQINSNKPLWKPYNHSYIMAFSPSATELSGEDFVVVEERELHGYNADGILPRQLTILDDQSDAY